MAEIQKLSVGQALEKLRGTDAPKAKIALLDEKIDTLDEETRRMRAMRRHIEQDQRAGPTKLDPHAANAKSVKKPKMFWITTGIFTMILVLAWQCL